MDSSTFKYNRLAHVATLLIFACLLVACPVAAGENTLLKLENGLQVRVYTPEDIMAMSTKDASGVLTFEVAGGASYRLIDTVLDPEIVNKGDGSFHPVNVDWAIDALSKVDISGRSLKMPVNLYVLPLPRSGLLSSSSCGDDIFLSPGVYEIGRCMVACTVTHELGHVFQNRYAAEGPGGAWAEYLEIRGLEDATIYSDDAPHADRPVEIFAEDFRYLFGGSEACYSGTIENPDLPLPDKVAGLEEYFAALAAPAGTAGDARAIATSNYPNPFNPSTTIRVVFNEPSRGKARDVDLSIYRVDGSLVRNLYRGAVTADELSVPWDGKDGRGGAVSSGIYFYAVRSAGRAVTGKMLLLR
ncbi:MAG: hypothetical protein ABR899_03775 [Candidatus Krumholzibacteriaceae bacterium]|jgi:hypothetical protein